VNGPDRRRLLPRAGSSAVALARIVWRAFNRACRASAGLAPWPNVVGVPRVYLRLDTSLLESGKVHKDVTTARIVVRKKSVGLSVKPPM
jgi:hypothetical protein